MRMIQKTEVEVKPIVAKEFVVPQKEELINILSRNNPSCPFYNLIGQNGAIEQCLAVLAQGLQNTNHRVSVSLLFTGNASSGKTEIAKRLSRGLSTPFVETDANQIKSTKDIFELSSGVCKENGLELNPTGTKNGLPLYVLPAMTIFIDEIHAIKKSVMNALLKSLESKDRMLLAEDYAADTRNVLWIGATTHYGVMLEKNEPFASRFDKIEFVSFSLEEVAQIVCLNYKDWNIEDARLIAKFSGGIARQALALAAKVNRQLDLMNLRQATTKLDAIEQVRIQSHIDEFCMLEKQVDILKALADVYPKGLTYGQLAAIACCGVEELRRHLLPALFVNNSEKEALIAHTGKVSVLREAGWKMLTYNYGIHEHFQHTN